MMKAWLVYDLPHRLEKIKLGFVWMLPKWLIYWSSIRMIAHATTGTHAATVVPDLTAVDALERWEHREAV